MKTIKTRLSENSGRPCSAPGCTKTCYGVSNYCHSHMLALREHGHINGRRVWPREYQPEHREVSRFLKKHSSHELIVLAEGALRDALAAASCDEAASDLKRIARHGVTPRDILTECAAVWLFARRNQRTLPDDQRLSFALGAAVQCLAPRERTRRYEYNGRTHYRYQRSPSGGREELGKALRSGLGVIAYHIATAIEREAEAARQAQRLAAGVSLHAFSQIHINAKGNQ